MTAASVNDFAQPARPRSEPSHSGVQNRRVDTWKMSAPTARSRPTSSPSWPGSSTILASKSDSFHCEMRTEMTKSGPVAARTASATSATNVARSAIDGPP